MIYTQNRELSWLKFNERVLSEAVGEDVPFFERLKFLSIFTSNLDEFFMVRVGSRFDLSVSNEQNRDNKTGMTPTQQLDAIYPAVRDLYKKRDHIYKEVLSSLRSFGIRPLRLCELSQGDAKFVRQYFLTRILPILSPHIVDASHPFPFAANKQPHIAVAFDGRDAGSFGIVALPPALPSVVYLPGEGLRYVHTSDIVYEYAADIFDRLKIKSKCIFCVTRNADISPDDEEFFDQNEDFRSVMKKLVKKRRLLAVVRIEVRGKLSSELKEMLLKRLEATPRMIYRTEVPLDLSFVFPMQSRLSEELRSRICYAPFSPQLPAKGAYFKRGGGDMLLSYPYHSMTPFLELIRSSALDPDVLSIKITIYRLARNAKLVEYLCAAAESGKDVLVIIELRARFDEQNNIDWSEQLESSGVRILYGFETYKIHSKLCLITRRDKGGLKRLVQIGTGNYNETTVKQYTDLCLITEDPEICADADEFFKNMSVSCLEGSYKALLISPSYMRSRIEDFIDGEIAKGSDGLIVMKVNSVTDLHLIKKLSEASCAGVKIYLLVRGICCLLPGIEGFTENIFIMSIVGRFLEHSRIYSFGKGDSQQLYISSADLMTRNMSRRVELACPIKDPRVKRQINHLLELNFKDTTKARVLKSDGTYERKRNSSDGISSQELLMKEAISDAAKSKASSGKISLWTRLKNFFSGLFK